MGCTRDQLVAELSRLGAKSWSFQRMSLFGRMVCPTPTRRGSPTLAWQFIFALKDRRLAMARDRFNTVAGNLRSLTLAIEAMRQLERHSGSTMMERAFKALRPSPHPTGRGHGARCSALRPIGAVTSRHYIERKLAIATPMPAEAIR